MAKPPLSGDNTTSSDHLQTRILKVYIHCEGCKKKVFKVLQSIDGVYKTVIDSEQHKAIVTGSVKGETLVQKLLKSGKHAEILPQSFEPPATKPMKDTGSQKRKKKQNNNSKQNNQDDEGTEHVEKEISEFKDVTIDENDTKNEDEVAAPAVLHGNGGKKKKKKKKNKNKMGDKSENKNGDTEGVHLPADTGEMNFQEPVEKLNLDTPMVSYDVPPYHNYYPIPAYEMSYSTSYPSTESSYYTSPVYGYAQSHPSGFNPARPPSQYYGRSAFDDHEDDGGEGRFCAVM